MALCTLARWGSRINNGVDFGDSSISGGNGIPRCKVRSWGDDVLQFGISDVTTKPTTEIENGFRFELGASRQLEVKWQNTLALPDSDIYQPEFGSCTLEYLIDTKPAEFKVGAEYWFPVKVEILDPTVTWYYQPALTKQEIDDGDHRPDWCIGSYALYAHDGRKVGHLTRPIIRDSVGQMVWGEFYWDSVNGILYKKFDMATVDALTLPFWVDANLGFDQIGGSSSAVSSAVQRATGGFDPGSNYSVLDMKFYGSDNSVGADATLGIFSDSSGEAANVLRDTAEAQISTSLGWHDFALDSALAVSNGTNYHLGFGYQTGRTINYYYDSALTLTYESKTYTAGTLQNYSSPTTTSRKVSIYAIETAASFTSSSTIIGGQVL